ncbi:hypothetical protein [Actinomadura sp. SCN-SB]|uniref:hypothetical protein n=1 Tax=Actinomadura sp. SCN-SB TaxID=3373092 RepID=UPI003751DE98
MTGDRALLRLGAQMAEVEALYARVLETPDAQAEGRALRELAGAGMRLAELANAAAEGRTPWPGTPATRVSRPRRAVGARAAARAGTRSNRTKLERRIARVESTTEWIITRTGGRH